MFLRLGLTSFGGPVAHLGYFHRTFVQRRGWLDDPAYAGLVVLAHTLPGPASSQVGFAIGLTRAGWLGGLAAWAGFTLPSAVLMTLFALGAGSLPTSRLGGGLVHGLNLAAVAIVAQALWGMARSLCPDRARAIIAIGADALATLIPAWPGQITAISLGGLAGAILCRSAVYQGLTIAPDTGAPAVPISRRAGLACLLAALGLLGLAIMARAPAGGGLIGLSGAFYRSGALVFGGGHVVLPLLHEAVVIPGWVSRPTFLAGYGAAQAMPGPLFSFAAFLGAVADGMRGAVTALFSIFLPGLLLMAGVLPFQAALRRQRSMEPVLRGVSAAAVGLLGAALCGPVWTGAVLAPADGIAAVAGFVLLMVWHAPPLLLVGAGAATGVALAALQATP